MLHIFAHSQITKQDKMQLINQLSEPFIIMGDTNARSTMCGDTNRDDRVKIVEEVALEANVIVLSNRNQTNYHSQTNTCSVIDLTICAAECRLDYMPEVIQDSYDSDHYPTQLKLVTHNLILPRLRS